MKVFEAIDSDGSQMISEFEFDQMKESPECMEALEMLGVEPKHLMAMSDTIFEADEDDLVASLTVDSLKAGSGDLKEPSSDSILGRRRAGVGITKPVGRELTFDEFLDFVVHLRPGTTASVLDMADLRKTLRRMSRKMERRFDAMEENL